MLCLLPVLGIDGCFIKLTTGAQILASTVEMAITTYTHWHLALLDKRTKQTGAGFYTN